jgi:hypothetical protein
MIVSLRIEIKIAVSTRLFRTLNSVSIEGWNIFLKLSISCISDQYILLLSQQNAQLRVLLDGEF